MKADNKRSFTNFLIWKILYFLLSRIKKARHYLRRKKKGISIIAILGLLLTLVGLYPSISPEPDKILRIDNPFQTTFTVKNDNVYPISNIHYTYWVYNVTVGTNTIDNSFFEPLYNVIPYLGPKKMTTFLIDKSINSNTPITSASLKICFDFKFLIFTIRDTFNFKVFKNYQGVYEWSHAN